MHPRHSTQFSVAKHFSYIKDSSFLLLVTQKIEIIIRDFIDTRRCSCDLVIFLRIWHELLAVGRRGVGRWEGERVGWTKLHSGRLWQMQVWKGKILLTSGPSEQAFGYQLCLFAPSLLQGCVRNTLAVETARPDGSRLPWTDFKFGVL